MASNSFWDKWTDDIDWDSVSSKGRKLSQAARQNLIALSAICTIAGGVTAVASLVGNYEPRVSFCDPRTKPCTKVEVSVNSDIPNVPTEFIPGYGLQRTAASVISVLLFGGGLLAIAKAEEEAEAIEPKVQLDRQLELERYKLEAAEEYKKLEDLSEIRAETHEQELREAQAELFFERNPHMVEEYLEKKVEPNVSQPEPETPLVIEESKSEQVEPEPDPLFFGVRLPESPQLGVEFWDWQWFNSRADDLPHIRIIAPTNGGKTTLCDWLADVVPHEERKVITVKRKPHQWVGIPVYGVPFEYNAVRDQLEGLLSEMTERTRLMEKGQYKGKLSAIVDEWKAIARNVKAIKDEETKQVINPSAKEIMGDLLTLARESGIKIFALAQGRQVITWGLEGESDILDCFATVYLGSFAVEEAENMQRKFAKNSDEFALWQKVIDFLKAQGKRAAWVETEFGKFPAIAPDLSEWKREIEPVTKDITIADTPHETQSQQEIEADSQQPLVIGQESIVKSQSPDDVDTDELLRQNLDFVLQGLKRSLIQSPSFGDGNHPELENQQDEQPEPLQQVESSENTSQDEKLYTPLNLTADKAVELIKQLRTELNQTQTIQRVWQVKKGGSKAWKKAHAEFKELEEMIRNESK